MSKDMGAPAQGNARVFCITLLVVALILFVLPYPTPGMAKRLAQIATTHASVSIVGPSTIDYVSACDTDRKTVPEMLASASGRKVLDLSVGGQPTADSLNLSAATLYSRSIKDVVLPITYPQSDDWTTPPYRQLLFYKMVVPQYRVAAADNRSDLWQGLSGEPHRPDGGYDFEGHHYPDYRALSAGVFLREKQASKCPEVVTHDMAFTRSYFWWTHIATRANQSLFGMAADLQSVLSAHGKRLHVIVLPTNLALLDRMQPGWSNIVETRQEAIVQGMAQKGVKVLDLSRAFGPDEFSTQWCACIHLNEKGRRHLANAISAEIGRDE